LQLIRTTRSFARAIAAVLIVELAAHGFAPAATSAPMQPAELSLEQALQVICSANGTRGLDQGHHGMRPGDSCPLCPAFTAPAVAAPPTISPAVPVWTRISHANGLPEATRYASPAQSFLARAPPAVSFA
jgi:hypothetical protein